MTTRGVHEIVSLPVHLRLQLLSPQSTCLHMCMQNTGPVSQQALVSTAWQRPPSIHWIVITPCSSARSHLEQERNPLIDIESSTCGLDGKKANTSYKLRLELVSSKHLTEAVL